MELWDGNVDLRQIFSCSDIPNIRVNLGHELYFSSKNQKDKALVNKLYREVNLFCSSMLFSIPVVFILSKISTQHILFYYLLISLFLIGNRSTPGPIGHKSLSSCAILRDVPYVQFGDVAIKTL